MSAFVSEDKVPVTIDGVNIIYIKPKMNYGSKKRVQGAIIGTVSEMRRGGMGMDIDLAHSNIVLLEENVVGWEGPDFMNDKGVKMAVNRVNLDKLDPDYPLLDMVLAEINARNGQTVPSMDGTQGPNLSASAG